MDIKMEEGRRQASPAPPPEVQSQTFAARVQESPSWRRKPNSKSYPPASSIPKTSPERLTLAAADEPSDEQASTVLYLAYGSNLSAETFLGVRGIRPVSQINVSAPSLDLTFDLPGFAYNEPCFANTRPRKLPKPPVPIPNPGKPPQFPPENAQESDPLLSLSPTAAAQCRGPTWTKGLYGVVYEVTRKDYATIIRTEGGGRSYKDVLTPCVELPPAIRVPEKPPIPELPKPFLAHTLYAPAPLPLPSPPGEDGSNEEEDDDGDDERDPRKQPWFRKLLFPAYRLPPDYAQPSARYLKLIRDGAAEHALPDEYQEYLAALQPYTMTTVRQRVGRILFLILALPLLIPLLVTSRMSSNEDKMPRWLGVVFVVGTNLLWVAYDFFFFPVFGDGERTIDEGNGKTSRRKWRRKGEALK